MSKVLEHKKEFTIATMKNVAEMAGVSTATVSRTLMNPEKVSPLTRQKVERAALAVGYFPHALSHRIKRSDSHTILVIVPDISNPFFVDILHGIEQTAARQGYLVLISNYAEQHQLKQTLVNLIITKQIDGILLLGMPPPFDTSKKERRNLPPMVMAIEFVPELDIPTVHIDNLTSAFEAVHYLYKLGHKKIACIAGPDSLSFNHYRLEGYIQALHRNSLTVEKNYIVQGDATHETGARALTALMKLAHPPTAIFCHNDMIAIGAIQQSGKLGILVPKDVSIIGFDNLSVAQYCSPPLTTVAQPRYQIGQEAMLLLLEQLQGHNVSTRSQLVETELIIRASTCAPGHQMTTAGFKK